MITAKPWKTAYNTWIYLRQRLSAPIFWVPTVLSSTETGPDQPANECGMRHIRTSPPHPPPPPFSPQNFNPTQGMFPPISFTLPIQACSHLPTPRVQFTASTVELSILCGQVLYQIDCAGREQSHRGSTGTDSYCQSVTLHAEAYSPDLHKYLYCYSLLALIPAHGEATPGKPLLKAQQDKPASVLQLYSI